MKNIGRLIVAVVFVSSLFQSSLSMSAPVAMNNQAKLTQAEIDEEVKIYREKESGIYLAQLDQQVSKKDPAIPVLRPDPRIKMKMTKEIIPITPSQWSKGSRVEMFIVAFYKDTFLGKPVERMPTDSLLLVFMEEGCLVFKVESFEGGTFVLRETEPGELIPYSKKNTYQNFKKKVLMAFN